MTLNECLKVSGTVSGRSDSAADSSLYLDSAMRSRLLAEHAVQCCTVVQRLGDVVLVPAMSPYQVGVARLNQSFKIRRNVNLYFNRPLLILSSPSFI